jgi:nitrogen fixation protein FixH
MSSSTFTDQSFANHGGGRKEVTGRMVLICLVTFFAVVGAVDFGMMATAISTFTGLDSDSPYQEGLAFEQEKSAAAAQQALRWQVQASVKKEGGATSVEVSARDATGKPLRALAATATLVHPTDRRLDRDLTLAEDAPGHFQGLTATAVGQWDLLIELSRDGARMFRSKNRVVLR